MTGTTHTHAHTHLKPETIPLEKSHIFSPTHALFITKSKHQTLVQDLTPSLSTIFTPPEADKPSALNLETATNLAGTVPAPPYIYTLKKENLLGTHLIVKDGEGKEVAEWKSPILSMHMGKTIISFKPKHASEAEGTEEKVEKVEVKPVGFARRAEEFVKDGVTYIWEVEPKLHQHKDLYKVIETSTNTEGEALPVVSRTKREIARYVQKTGYSTSGLLVLDARELDELVGILTLCAMLEAVEKEEKVDKVYDSVVSGMIF